MDRKQQTPRRDELITLQDLAAFGEELLAEIKKMLLDNQGRSAKQWIKAAEIKKMLRLSDGKLSYLRDRGVIPFTKLGGITYYNLKEIEELMQSDKLHDT